MSRGKVIFNFIFVDGDYRGKLLTKSKYIGEQCARAATHLHCNAHRLHVLDRIRATDGPPCCRGCRCCRCSAPSGVLPRGLEETRRARSEKDHGTGMGEQPKSGAEAVRARNKRTWCGQPG